MIVVNTAAYQAEGGAGALRRRRPDDLPDDLARQEAAAALEEQITAKPAVDLWRRSAS